MSTKLQPHVADVESDYDMLATDLLRPVGKIDMGATNDLPAVRGEAPGKERAGRLHTALQILAPHVKRILYRPAAGSPLIAETGIAESNVSDLVDALRKRSSQPEARGARLAGRLLLRLTTESAPGQTTVAGVKVTQLRRLVELLREVDGPEHKGSTR